MQARSIEDNDCGKKVDLADWTARYFNLFGSHTAVNVVSDAPIGEP